MPAADTGVTVRRVLMIAASVLVAGVAAIGSPAPAGAADDVSRIGVLNDQSGVYADLGGVGSVIAAQMAVEDAGGKVLGRPVEVINADHQSKADVGAAIARKWFDEDNVDVVIGFDNSSVALAVEQVALQKNRIAIAGAIGTTAFTGKNCTPNEAAWVYDAYALTTAAVLAADGKVLGHARHPINTSDFSSYLLQAQASGAKVVALANAGGDMINAIKQANEFGLTRGGQKVVSLLTFITDIQSVGLTATQGLTFVTAFYWNRNDESRAWSKRFFERHKRMPTMAQAAVYSMVRHYLRAVEAAGTDEAEAVMAKMRDMPVNDFYAKNGRVRLDGRMVHDMYFVQVKTPAESTEPWDYYKVLETIPGDQAFRPLDQGGCPVVKQVKQQ
jgi:branched-chain amino acid transport system substrate-binding protein